MIEGFYGEFRPSPLRRLHDHADNMVVLPRIVWLPSVSLIDLPVHPGSSSPMPSEVRVEQPAPQHARMSETAARTAIRRIFAAIKRLRQRAQARVRLLETSDHLLKDIGLSRVDLAPKAAPPAGHRPPPIWRSGRGSDQWEHC